MVIIDGRWQSNIQRFNYLIFDSAESQITVPLHDVTSIGVISTMKCQEQRHLIDLLILIRTQRGTAFASKEELGFPSASHRDDCECPHMLSPQCSCPWIAFEPVSSHCMCDACTDSSSLITKLKSQLTFFIFKLTNTCIYIIYIDHAHFSYLYVGSSNYICILARQLVEFQLQNSVFTY